MRGEWSISIPEREQDEEDATEKQVRFIERLYKSLNSEGIPIEPDTLGKWQASAFIDQLIEIRDHREQTASFEGWDEDELSAAKPKNNPFYQGVTGQITKVILTLLAIFIGWVIILW